MGRSAGGQGWWRAAAAVAVVGVLFLTLRPERVAYGVNLVPLSQHLPAIRALLRGGSGAAAAARFLAANMLGNIALFLPLGACLAGGLRGRGTRWWRWRRTVAFGAALSTAIEIVQLGLPSRATDVDDVLFNTLGAALGAALLLLAEGAFERWRSVS